VAEFLHPHPHGRAKDLHTLAAAPPPDPGTQSLADALRISFWLLKVFVVIVVIVYFCSGFFTVAPEEVALVLRFGTIRTEEPLGPGAHWAWPFPVDEVVRIPAKKTMYLDIGTFWYKIQESAVQRAYEGTERFPEGQVPGGEGGYLLTGDRNIINTMWRVYYRIADPIAYFRHVHDPERLVRSVVEAAVVQVTAKYEVFDALYKNVEELRNEARRLAQKQLNDMQTGIEITSLERRYWTPPLVAKSAFDAVLVATQEVDQKRNEARAYRNRILSEAAGAVGVQLAMAIDELEEATRTGRPESEVAPLRARVKELYERAGGDVARIRAEAEAYRTMVSEEARGDAEYIQRLLQQYGAGPGLQEYLKQYRIEKLMGMLAQAEDKYLISAGSIERLELRPMLSPPPELLKEKRKVEETR